MAQADPGKGGSPVVSEVYADNITTTSATLHGTVYGNGLQSVVVFQYGKTTSYGTTTTEYATVNPYQTLQVSITVDGLDSNCTYHFRLRAGNNNGFTDSEDSQFYTTTNAPTATTLSAEDVTSNSATLRATINPNGIRTTWAFQMGTSTDFDTQLEGGNLAAGSSDRSVSLPVSNMTPNTTYYYRVIALHTNPISIVMGATKSVTTEEVVVPDCFDDCTSSSCGENGAQMYEAAQYLCARGIVEGINYDLLPDQEVTRAQLAKVALFGLYNGPDNIPNPLVTDYFPSIYPDLQNDTAYYYQAAKALLYLEYGDGRSPFDRDRAVFDPTGTISRCLVLKVLLETFNIAPATSGSNPFSDYDSSDQFWGYAKKAYDLGIVQVSTFNPHQNCTRGQAFLFLYRIMTGIANNTIPAPNPINSESPATSSFFIPANLSAEVVNAMRGVEYGNYNYYQKDFFGIPGYMYLSFGISYNSYLTEMPEDFYPVQPLGKAWTHTYDMYMNIVTDPYNNLSYYVFHLRDGALLIYDNDLSTVTEGNFYTLSQSGSKFILKSVDQVTYTFEKKSTSDGIYYLTQIKDRNDNTIDITYAYGSSHYRITSVSTLGRTLSFYYKSGTDLLYYVKDPIFRKVYFYYTDDQLTSLKDAKNQTTSFEYGTMDFEKGLLKRITLPRGNEVCNNYQQRKLTSTRYNNDIPTTISIVPSYQNGSTNSRVIRPVDGNHVDTTDYTMNGNNCITRMKNSEKDLSFSYGDSNHATLVSQMTDNKSNLHASYTYNVKGLITQISVSAGGETVTTKFTYDVNNNVRSYTDANNNKTNYYYDSNGNLTSVKDPLGNTTTITNNSYGSPTQVTNPMGVTTTYQYNSYGNVTNIAVPSLNLSGTITYDDVSRIISKTDMGGNLTSYTYDANDNVLTETDALNNVTTYAFDANDNVTSITNAKGFSTFMTYDDNDFVTSVAFQNAIRNYTYNNDGTLKSYTDPNGHVFNYSYNDAGDLLNDGYATYSYNNKGMLTSVTKDNKAIEYAYDAFYRVSSVSYDGKTVSYTYDYNNNITSITYPGNKTVTYSYDALNRMTSVTDWNNATTTYSYRDDNQLSYYQYPNQVRTTIGYDNAGRCTSMTTRRSSGNGSTISSYDFTLNSLGSHVQESITEPFASYPTIPSVGITYSYNNANRLLSAGDLTFTYDNNGNTTSRSGRNYSYDSKDNLTGVSGDFTASYSYDGWGYRRSATRNGESKKYVLDLLSGDGNVIMETDNSGNALYYYVYGVSGLISRISASNETRYYVYDYRGSTVAMTDASTAANITHQYQYDDFGKVLQSQESDANSFQFVGQYGVMYEAEGLTFMRARYYDESVGRFLSEDPIWSVNLYPYAGNNPISFIDPNGNKSIELCLWGGEKMKNAITTLRTAASNYSAAGGQKAHIATELEHSLTSSTVETPQFAQKINEAYNETKPVVNNVVQNSSNFVQNSSSEVANQTALLGGSAGAAIGYAAVGVGVVVGASAGAYYLGKAGHKGWAYGVGVGGGIAGGALAGAAIGSFFGPAGLVVGAIIGGAVGGVLGYLNARAGVNQYYEDNRYTL
jgi:RHS repeat-associated protein